MLALVLIVRVEDPEPNTDVGTKAAVAPVGNPVAEKLTVPVKPAIEAIDIVEFALPPAVSVIVPGVAEIEKSGLETAGANAGSKVLAMGEPSPVT